MSSLPCPTEAVEGEILVAWLRLHNLKFTHIANESNAGNKQAMIRGAKMKRQGVSRGFPDYVIALPGVGVLYIELKRVRGSTTSPEQHEWVRVLNECPNTEAHICKGAEAAIAVIEELLSSASSTGYTDATSATPISGPDDALLF